jgi:hypothetical protein
MPMARSRRDGPCRGVRVRHDDDGNIRSAPRLAPVYERIGTLLGEKIGCKVQVFIATSYNAEIEAMRSGKLDIGEFGPLGYVLAHQIEFPTTIEAASIAAAWRGHPRPDGRAQPGASWRCCPRLSHRAKMGVLDVLSSESRDRSCGRSANRFQGSGRSGRS